MTAPVIDIEGLGNLLRDQKKDIERIRRRKEN
jgi:hypothetical protein